MPQRTRRSTWSDREPPKDGIPRDIYGKPLKNLVRKYPLVTKSNVAALQKNSEL
jgi:hypothetical protein